WSLLDTCDAFIGGSNGIIGIGPSAVFTEVLYYSFVLALVVLSAWALRWLLSSPFGYAMRASRDSVLRAQALGMDVMRIQWLAFVIAGVFAGLAGALFVFAKGSTSPDVLSITRSVDALVMVLLGGVQYVSGPILGAGAFQLLQDYFTGLTTYWHAFFGLVILMLVLAFPTGLAGAGTWLQQRYHRRGG